MAKRRCKGTTKAGKRCRAYALADSQFCRAHDPLRPAETRFGSAEQAAAAGALGGAAGRSPRVVDVMRERVEAHVDEVLAPYFAALTEGMLTATFQGDVFVSEHPDLAGRVAAAEKLLDRVYGKPRQTIEHAGPAEGSPIPVEFTLSERTREAIGDALRSRPASG